MTALARLRGLAGFGAQDAAARGLSARLLPPDLVGTRLTLFLTTVLAGFSVLAIALALAAGQLASGWGQGLAGSATLRLSAPPERSAAQTAAVLEVLRATPGVLGAVALPPEAEARLLAPFLGSNLPVDLLPLPQLVALTLDTPAPATEDLRARIEAVAPGAVLEDHAGWRAPLAAAARQMRMLGLLASALGLAAVGAAVTLASQAALAGQTAVIAVLRQLGARDAFIAVAFVRRQTLAALAGATLGTVLGLVALAVLQDTLVPSGLRLGGGEAASVSLLATGVPLAAAAVGWLAARRAARRVLRAMP